MSRQPVREPEKTGEGISGDRYEHPAFATIHASRVSGQTDLFASNVGHSGFVRITIQPATLQDDGYSRTVFGSVNPYAVVDLSEAQWVALVSRMNMGSGTPCTLRSLRLPKEADSHTFEAPELPPAERFSERMKAQATKMGERQGEHVDEAEKRLTELLSKLPKKDQQAANVAMQILTQHGRSNSNFARKQLIKEAERLVVEAMQEIDSAINDRVKELGISSLKMLGEAQAQPATIPTLPMPGTENPTE